MEFKTILNSNYSMKKKVNRNHRFTFDGKKIDVIKSVLSNYNIVIITYIFSLKVIRV